MVCGQQLCYLADTVSTESALYLKKKKKSNNLQIGFVTQSRLSTAGSRKKKYHINKLHSNPQQLEKMSRTLECIQQTLIPVEVAMWAENCTFNEWFCWTSVCMYIAHSWHNQTLRALHAFYPKSGCKCLWQVRTTCQYKLLLKNALDAFTGDLFGDIFEISGPTEKILVKKTWHTLSTNLHKIQLMQNQ